MTNKTIEKQETELSDNLRHLQDGTSAEQLDDVKNRITVVRGLQVMLDRDLAKLYHVDVGYMNRQVKRNIIRFPKDFMFQLTKEEADSLKCQNGISKTRGGDRVPPYAFTEQGISMLSGLLRSETAIQANILIMRAFVAMRHFLLSNAQLFQRMDRLEYRQLETDNKISALLFSLISISTTPSIHQSTYSLLTRPTTASL